jgi:tripeptidyl-peptidase-1
MFILRSLPVVAILATACVARPTNDFSKAVVEKLDAAPVGWVKDSSAKLDKDATSITLKVHLVNQDMDKFHDLAMNVWSSPGRQHDRIEVDLKNRLLLLATRNTDSISTTKRFLL